MWGVGASREGSKEGSAETHELGRRTSVELVSRRATVRRESGMESGRVLRAGRSGNDELAAPAVGP